MFGTKILVRVTGQLSVHNQVAIFFFIFLKPASLLIMLMLEKNSLPGGVFTLRVKVKVISSQFSFSGQLDSYIDVVKGYFWIVLVHWFLLCC